MSDQTINNWAGLVPVLESAVRGFVVFGCGYLLVRLLRNPAPRQRAAEWTLVAVLLVPLAALLPFPTWGGVNVGSWLAADGSEHAPDDAQDTVTSVAAVLPNGPAGPSDRTRLDHELEHFGPQPWQEERDAVREYDSTATNSLPRTLEESPTVKGTGIAWPIVCWVVLFVGSSVAAGWSLLGYLRLEIMRRKGLPPPEHVLVQWRQVVEAGGTKQRRCAQLLISEHVAQPITFGVLRPVVLLPTVMADALRCSGDELRLTLCHEYSHVHRRDAVSWLLFSITLPLYYWNPLLWLMRRELRMSQELIADAAAAECAGSPVEYAQHLLNLARLLVGRKTPLPASGIFARRSELYRRVRKLMLGSFHTNATCGRARSVAMAVGLLLVCGALSSVSVWAEIQSPNKLTADGAPAPASRQKNSQRWLHRLGSDALRNRDLPTCVAYTPDGRWLVCAGHDDLLSVFDPKSGELVRRMVIEGNHGGTMAMDFSPDGKHVGIAGRNGTLTVIAFATGEQVFALERSTQGFYAIKFSPDGKKLVTGKQWGSIELRDSRTGELLETFAPSMGNMAEDLNLEFSPDGKRIASNRRNGYMVVWEIDNPQTPYFSKQVSEDRIRSITFLGDGDRILTRGGKRDAAGQLVPETKIWEVETGDLLREIATEDEQTGPAVVSHDQRQFAVATQLGIRVYDLESGKLVRNLEDAVGFNHFPRGLAFNPAGTQLATCGAWFEICVWDIASGKRQFHDPTQLIRTPYYLDVSPDGTRLLTAGDSVLNVWDAATGEILRSHRLDVGKSNFYRAKFSPDGSAVIACGIIGKPYRNQQVSSGALLCWDANSGELNYAYRNLRSYSQHLAISADGNWGAVFGGGTNENELPEIFLFNPNTGEHLGTASLPAETQVAGLWFASNNTLQALTRTENQVLSWQVPTLTATDEPAELPNVTELALTHDQQLGLANYRTFGTPIKAELSLINMNTLEKIRTFDLQAFDGNDLEGAPSYIETATISGDGRLVAALNPHGEIGVVDARSGKRLAIVAGFPAAVRSLVFSPDGKRLLCGLNDTTSVVVQIPFTADE